ncbi:MAG TPA: hypothetical protein VFZ29_06210 [Solirubrobacterales bacterium]
MVLDEVGDRTFGAGQRLPGLPSLLGPTNQASLFEIFERLGSVDLTQPGNGLAAPGNDDLGPLFDLLQVLAEAIVELTNSNLGRIAM